MGRETSEKIAIRAIARSWYAACSTRVAENRSVNFTMRHGRFHTDIRRYRRHADRVRHRTNHKLTAVTTVARDVPQQERCVERSKSMTTTTGRLCRRMIGVATAAFIGTWFGTPELKAQSAAAILGTVNDPQ